MTHVAFLIGAYYPNFSAVGYCAYQVHKHLKKETQLTVIAQRGGAGMPLTENLDGIMILRIETNVIRRRNAAMAGAGLVARLALLLNRIHGAARRLLGPETVDRVLVRAYFDQLSAMDPPPSVIVPTVFPIETVFAALDYKRANPGVAVYPYLFDDFVESGSLHVLKVARWLKRGRHLRLERQMLEGADAVLSIHPLKAHFEAHFEAPLVDKITFLEHPLLLPPKASSRSSDDGVTRLCYTGSLIRKVREADYLIDLLRAAPWSTKVCANFYVMGNGADAVPTEQTNGAIQIVNHGQVSKAAANEAVLNADFLINIGEVQGRQVSSKIFEYMSTGKPIIHLAYVQDDSVTKILEKYPLALCLLQDRHRMRENGIQLNNFIKLRARESVPFDEIKSIYPEALPEVTAEFMTELCRNVPHSELCRNVPH